MRKRSRLVRRTAFALPILAVLAVVAVGLTSKKAPMSGRIHHVFTHRENFAGVFLWKSVRDGLVPVVRK